MAQTPYPQSIEVYLSWVDAIETEASDDLNSWETDFMTSVAATLDRGRMISEKQAVILERIYAEKTS